MNMSKKSVQQLVEETTEKNITKTTIENPIVTKMPNGRVKINLARMHEKKRRYEELAAERRVDKKSFDKDKKKRAELFDLYNELIQLDVMARRKQRGKDTAKRKGRTNMTPPKKRRK